MSGIVGHSMYALLGLKAAALRNLPLVRLAERHRANYLAGAYLGCDIQTMPEAVCVDTGREVGYGTVPLEKSPITGGAVRQFRLSTPSGPLTPREVHERFYGRAHLLFGFTQIDAGLHVPWDHLPDYFAAVFDDAFTLFGTGERQLAYALGWIAHVVSDSLIKGIQPGVALQLIDGRYTARNRPVQDLFAYHEVGIKEMKLDWSAMFSEMADTPVERLQRHYMRCAKAQGHLGGLFAFGWQAEVEPTLVAVLTENRRWLRHHADDVLADMKLINGQCNDRIHDLVGMTYNEMIEAANKAELWQTLVQIGDEIATMFEAVVHRCERLARLE